MGPLRPRFAREVGGVRREARVWLDRLSMYEWPSAEDRLEVPPPAERPVAGNCWQARAGGPAEETDASRPRYLQHPLRRNWIWRRLDGGSDVAGPTLEVGWLTEDWEEGGRPTGDAKIRRARLGLIRVLSSQPGEKRLHTPHTHGTRMRRKKSCLLRTLIMVII